MSAINFYMECSTRHRPTMTTLKYEHRNTKQRQTRVAGRIWSRHTCRIAAIYIKYILIRKQPLDPLDFEVLLLTPKNNIIKFRGFQSGKLVCDVVFLYNLSVLPCDADFEICNLYVKHNQSTFQFLILQNIFTFSLQYYLYSLFIVGLES